MIFRKLLDGLKAAPIGQFLKFGLVGVSNTAISYGIEMFCFYVLFRDCSFPGIIAFCARLGISNVSADTVRVLLTSALAFVVSVSNAYYWNSRHVFKSGTTKTVPEHIAAYFRSVACYGLSGLILAPYLRILLCRSGVPYWLSSLLTLAVTVPLNFVMSKFWAFREKKH